MKWLLLVIFLLPTMTYSSPVNSQTTFNPDNFIQSIIEQLEDHKYYDGENLGWLYRHDSQSFRYELVYNGHTMGIAGIGDFLVQAYNAGFNSSWSLIEDISNHFIQTSINPTIDQVYWERYVNLNSYGWTAYRYGSAGIMEFLAKAQKIGITNISSTLIENATNWMMGTKTEYGYWPISEDSYVTTGLDYGGSGMGYSLLQLYNMTGNTSYLDSSIELADYLINISIASGEQIQMSWTPALDDPSYLGARFSGISVGEAGIMRYFDQLYRHTQNQTYLDIATGLANDLLSLDLGGYWSEGTVGYINPFPGDSTGLIGFLVGATGTSYELLNFYEKYGNSEYLDSAMATVDFVEPFLHSDGSVSVGIDLEEYKYTGYGIGGAGVANYFIELYKFTENPLHYAYAERILMHLYDLMQQYGLLPIDESDLDLGYSFNIEDGLAGVGLALLNFKSVAPPENPYTFSVLTTTTSTRTTTSTPNSEETVGVDYPFLMILAVLPVQFIIRKYKSKFV